MVEFVHQHDPPQRRGLRYNADHNAIKIALINKLTICNKYIVDIPESENILRAIKAFRKIHLSTERIPEWLCERARREHVMFILYMAARTQTALSWQA